MAMQLLLSRRLLSQLVCAKPSINSFGIVSVTSSYPPSFFLAHTYFWCSCPQTRLEWNIRLRSVLLLIIQVHWIWSIWLTQFDYILAVQRRSAENAAAPISERGLWLLTANFEVTIPGGPVNATFNTTPASIQVGMCKTIRHYFSHFIIHILIFFPRTYLSLMLVPPNTINVKYPLAFCFAFSYISNSLLWPIWQIRFHSKDFKGDRKKMQPDPLKYLSLLSRPSLMSIWPLVTRRLLHLVSAKSSINSSSFISVISSYSYSFFFSFARIHHWRSCLQTRLTWNIRLRSIFLLFIFQDHRFDRFDRPASTRRTSKEIGRKFNIYR